MRWPGPIDTQRLRRWTIRLGVASFLVMAFPALTVVCLISIVGIPLGLVMLFLPTLFEIVALAYVAQRVIGRDHPLMPVASFAISGLVLWGVAGSVNAGLDARAREFLADDLDTLETPLRAKAIALVHHGGVGGFRKDEARCHELCQRLLLSGAVERILVPANWTKEPTWTAATAALSYRFEPRESCPSISVAGLSSYPVDEARPDEAMRLAIASGRCLVEEQATFADAEAVVAIGRVKSGQTERSAGLGLTADTVRVDRATVHVREQGGFIERYRWSGARVLLHWPIPVPTLVGGAELNMYPGFARVEKKLNTRDFAPDDVVSTLFARDELGLDIRVPAPPPSQSPAAVIQRGLDAPGPLAPATGQVVEDFFASLRDARQIDEATRQLAFRALDDPRVPAPRDTWALVRPLEKAGDAVNAELADILFRKLMATDPEQKENHSSYLGYLAGYLANAIRILPASAVLPHRRELEAIARDPARRSRAYPVLMHLSAFGADAVPTTLFLVDAGIALRNASRSRSDHDREDWQGPYGSGLVALCRIGSDGSAAIEPLLARLGEGSLPTNGSSGELLLTTLVRIGADPAALRSHFVTADASPEHFDREVARAQTRPDCEL